MKQRLLVEDSLNREVVYGTSKHCATVCLWQTYKSNSVLPWVGVPSSSPPNGIT